MSGMINKFLTYDTDIIIIVKLGVTFLFYFLRLSFYS